MITSTKSAHLFLRMAALASLVFVAACTNSTKPDQLPQFAISGISVQLDPSVKANSDIAATTDQAARRVAGAYSASLPANLPDRKLDIVISKVHYKNPIASLLIGDTNRASGSVAVSGKPPSNVVYVDVGGAIINGVLGAAIAIGSDKAKIDAKLAAGLAEKAVASAYDLNSTPKFVKDNLEKGNIRRRPSPPNPAVDPPASDPRSNPTDETVPTS